MRPRATTLTGMLEERAEQRPDSPTFRFLLDGDCGPQAPVAVLTAGELAVRARAIGAEVAELCEPGDRVLLLHPPGKAYLQAFWGCLQAGAIPVPAYPPSPAALERALPKLLAMMESSGAKVVLTTSEIEPFARPLLKELPQFHHARWLATDVVPSSSAGAWKRPQLKPDSLALLQYTSGSTSMPKGVMVTHANLLHNCNVVVDACDDVDDRSGVVWLPPYHDMGLLSGLILPLYATNGVAVVMSPLDFLKRPMRWLEAMSRHRGYISAAPNFAYELCVKRSTPEQRAALDLSAWEVAINGAEPIRAETLERFNEAFAPAGFQPRTWFPCYGLAESTLLASGGRRGAGSKVRAFDPLSLEGHRAEPSEWPSARKLVGCGKAPSAADEIRIVEASTAQPLPARRVGEIWLKGPSVAKGYWGRPEETAATFGARLSSGDGPWLRTGDLGFLDDGELFVTGRIKDLLIIAGKNHYPQDLELTVEKVDAGLRVGCGAAFSFDEASEEVLGIVYELEVAAAPNADKIVAAIRRALIDAHDVQPFAIALVAPSSAHKTSSGKIQRSACRAAYLAGELELVAEWRKTPKASLSPEGGEGRGEGPVAAARRPHSRDPLPTPDLREWMITEIASAAGLKPEQISPDQPFAHFGLTSVQMVGLAGALEEKLGRKLAPVLVWEYPTIDRLAAHLEGRSASRAAFSPGLPAPEPIAIVGIGCRFPKASGPSAFWAALRDGVDAVGELPAARLELSPQLSRLKAVHPWGAFLDGVEQFDPAFFHLSMREAVSMDPQQRILLELAWEALSDAGIAPASLAGSSTGVFVGISAGDYGRLAPLDPQSLTGNAFSIAANRLSYALDLKGPSMALDTACSSSLVAVHLACESLWSGEATAALAGGVNLVLTPHISEGLARGGFLSSDGRCKTFDARANGYVRGEGAGLVVLKRLSRALQDGDEVYALIRGTAVNSDGRSNGLTAPSLQAQEDVLRRAYARAGVEPRDVQYVEAHGTGTALGDPIEAAALGAVVGSGRAQPCRVGSVKTNLGHLESAAGIAGLVKTALALSQRTLPGTLHFTEANPYIPFEGLGLHVQRATEAWPSAGPRRAGVSSFGFGGTNAHAVLEEAPEKLARSGTPRLAAPAWMRVRCWPEASEQGVLGEKVHPLLGAPVGVVPQLGRVWENVLDPRELPWLSEHRVGGVAVLPAAGFVELALAAVGAGTIEALEVKRPLKLDVPQRIQGVLTGSTCQMFVRPARDANAEWVLTATAKVSPERPAVETLDLAAIQQRCSTVVKLDELWARMAAHGLDYGPAFRGLKALWRGDGEVLGGVEAPDALGPQLSAYRAHPAFLDACAQVVGALDPQGRAFLPVGARSVRFFRDAGSRAWSWARRSKDGDGIDLTVLDDTGNPALEILGLELKYLDELGTSSADRCLYEIAWREQALTETAAAATAGPCVIFCDRGGVGAALAAQLTALGRACVRVEAGDAFEQRGPDHFIVSPGQRDELARLISQVKPAIALHLWSLDVAGDDLEKDQRLCATSALFAFQALARIKQPRGRMWLVTRGAQPAGEAAVTVPARATLWGLGRTFAWEHADAWGGLIDLEESSTSLSPEGGEGRGEGPSALSEAEAARIANELFHGGSERQVAWRDRRYVPRLTRASAPAVPPELKPDGAYLVTGGLGALGLRVAEGLAERGARRLILLGRSALPPRAQWSALPPGDRAAGQVAAIRRLESRGVSVHVAAVDVASHSELAAFLGRFRDEGWPKVRGVVHLAGVLADRALMNLDADALLEVFRAKVGGAWALHRLLEAEPLDFFVLFSSVAAVLGSAGQANYAAANAFLDALAHHRRARGLPAASLAWGPWDDLGLAAGASERLASGGVISFPPAEGVALAQQLLGAEGQLTVLKADWPKVAAALGSPPFVAELAVARDPAAAAGGAMRQRLLELPEAERPTALTSVLVERISEALGAATKVRADQALDAMGLDSLMGIELRAQLQAELGVNVEMALLLSGPTIEQLSAVLCARLRNDGPAPAAARAAAPRMSPIQAAGTRPPFFCVHPGAVDVSVYAALAKELGPDQPFYSLCPNELESSYTGDGDGTLKLTSIERLAERCLTALREKQPSGPYHLGGWSLGGVLAFEMARQLEAKGERVALLALFDSPTPSGSPPVAPDDAELVPAFASYLGVRQGVSAPVHQLDGGVSSLDDGLARVLAWGKQHGVFPESHSLAQVRPLFSGYVRGLGYAVSHLNDYRPGVYAGRIVYFRAAGALRAYDEAFPRAATGWSRLTSQPLEVVETVGDHYTMFLDPHVQTLARRFGPLLGGTA